jgi:hypothetical protein
MTEEKTRRRDPRLVATVVSEVLEGAVDAFFSFIITFLLCAGFAALGGLVIGIETGSASRTIRFIQIGWQLQLLAQFVDVRISSIPVGITPLLLTLVVMGLVTAFMSHRKPLRPRVVGSGMLSWLLFTLLVQWSFQADLDDAWYIYIPKICGVYLLAFLPRVIRSMREARRRRAEGFSTGLRAARWDGFIDFISPGLRLARVLLFALLVESAVIACGWCVQGAPHYRHICSILGMKSVSFTLCVVLSLLWAPNMLVWAGVWAAGGTLHIGTIATYTLGAAKGTGLPLLPILGLLPSAVSSAGMRSFFRLLPWLLAACVTVVFTLVRRGFGWIRLLDASFARIRVAEQGTDGDPTAPATQKPAASLPQPSSAPAPHQDGIADTDAWSSTVQRSTAQQSIPAKEGRQAARNSSSSRPIIRAAQVMARQIPSLLIGSVLVLLSLCIAVLVSNGALGTKALSFLGVSVADALRVLGIPSVAGVLIGWLLTCLVALLLLILREHGVTPAMVGDKMRRMLTPLFSRSDSSSTNPDDTSEVMASDRSADGRAGGSSADMPSDRQGITSARKTLDGYPETTAQSATDFFRSSNAATGSAADNNVPDGTDVQDGMMSASTDPAEDGHTTAADADGTHTATATEADGAHANTFDLRTSPSRKV